jgi:hypothetical protein
VDLDQKASMRRAHSPFMRMKVGEFFFVVALLLAAAKSALKAAAAADALLSVSNYFSQLPQGLSFWSLAQQQHGSSSSPLLLLLLLGPRSWQACRRRHHCLLQSILT